MTDEAVAKATGKTKTEWFKIIHAAGKADLPHKEIARFLREKCGASDWWAQEITVIFEKETGRRVLGQTADAGFQLGVSKTVYTAPGAVWVYLMSREGFELISGPLDDGVWKKCRDNPAASGQSKTGIEFTVTTFKDGSHLRMRWKKPEWQSHSILQVRLTDKSTHEKNKTAVTIHHEKLPDPEAREELKAYWKEQMERIS
jgi:hypothetical protein